MKFLNKPVNLALIIYISIIAIIVFIKPKIFFKSNGEMKCTGCGDNRYKSIFSFPVFIVLSSMIIYFMVNYFYK